MAAVWKQTEESPDSTGQDAGESARRGDPRKVQQRVDRLSVPQPYRGVGEQADPLAIPVLTGTEVRLKG